MVEPCASILRAAHTLFASARGFDPRTTDLSFRVAASDYLDPLFLPQLVSQIKAQAPLCHIEIHPLSADSDYQAHLAQGEVDVVVGNWEEPPDSLHRSELFTDEVVCLVARDHPAVRTLKKLRANDSVSYDAIPSLARHDVVPYDRD